MLFFGILGKKTTYYFYSSYPNYEYRTKKANPTAISHAAIEIKKIKKTKQRISKNI